MCDVISLLMSYVSSLSVKNILDAVEANNSEQLVAQMILAFSLNTNQLLEIIYTGLVAFYLMKEALTIADAFANGGYGKTETLPSKIITFSTNTIKRVTKVGREEVDLQMNTKTLYDKISKDKLSWKQSRDSLLNRIHKNGDN